MAPSASFFKGSKNSLGALFDFQGHQEQAILGSSARILRVGSAILAFTEEFGGDVLLICVAKWAGAATPMQRVPSDEGSGRLTSTAAAAQKAARPNQGPGALYPFLDEVRPS